MKSTILKKKKGRIDSCDELFDKAVKDLKLTYDSEIVVQRIELAEVKKNQKFSSQYENLKSKCMKLMNTMLRNECS